MKSAEALPLGHLQCILLMMCVYIFQMCARTYLQYRTLYYIVMNFTFQLVQTFHLHRWWLSPVATCGSGAFSFSHWCKQSTCTHGGSPSATCTGGAFSSSHWRKYCTCTRATCTVWWWYSYDFYMPVLGHLSQNAKCCLLIF